MNINHRPKPGSFRSPCSPAACAPSPRPPPSPSPGRFRIIPTRSPSRRARRTPLRTPRSSAHARSPCPAGPARRSSASPSRSLSLHHLRPLEVPGAGFRQDSQAAGDLLIAFLNLAEVAAEAVLVHLLVRLAVPQPAVIRADLIGQDDPHLLVLPQPAELQLEVDQGNADA